MQPAADSADAPSTNPTAEEMAVYLEQDIIGVLLQYLREKGYQETARKYT